MNDVFGAEWVTRAARTAQHLRDDERALTSLITQLLEDHLHVDHTENRVRLEWAQGLNQTPEIISAALRHVYQVALRHCTSPQANRRRVREHIGLLEEVWRGAHNQQRSLPLGLIAWGSCGQLEIFSSISSFEDPQEISLSLRRPFQKISLEWGAWEVTLTPDLTMTSEGAYLSRAQMPLKLRLPPKGARYHPYKAPGSKRVKRLWSDRKVPLSERRYLPVLIDDSGQILWAPYCRPATWLYQQDQARSDLQAIPWCLTWVRRTLSPPSCSPSCE